MREPKFRVWDKDLDKYLEGCEIESLMADLCSKGEGREVIIKQICPARYVFEQYTGLKDEKGKEICDGDIVSVHTQYYIETFEIAWREDKAGWFGFTTDDYTSPLCNIRYAEVIGNVHENADLLEEEK